MAEPKKLNFAKTPTQPPSGADMNALVVALNEARAQLNLPPHVSKLSLWKRWVGAEKEYDVVGLRDVVNANAYGLEALKNDFDGYQERSNNRAASLEDRVGALEARPQVPFPGSS